MEQSHTFLNEISTRWPMISDPVQFVMRYAPAIRRYLAAIVKNDTDLEDVIQDFLMRVVQKGIIPAETLRGRFRDYLKTALRNNALTFLRQKNRLPQPDEHTIAGLPDPDENAEREWVAEWRANLISQTLEALEEYERTNPEGRFFTVLSTSIAHPELNSEKLAELVAEKTNRPMSGSTFRKQLSRARTMFAQLLKEEVRQTLQNPTNEEIEEELAELGLQTFLEPTEE